MAASRVAGLAAHLAPSPTVALRFAPPPFAPVTVGFWGLPPAVLAPLLADLGCRPVAAAIAVALAGPPPARDALAELACDAADCAFPGIAAIASGPALPPGCDVVVWFAAGPAFPGSAEPGLAHVLASAPRPPTVRCGTDMLAGPPVRG